MKKVAGTLRLDLAQFRELEAFAKFGSDLDKSTLAQLTRGQRMVEILKQGQYVPMRVEEQIVIIFAASKGAVDDIDLDKINEFEKKLMDSLRTSNPEVLSEISSKGQISEELDTKLTELINSYKKGFLG